MSLTTTAYQARIGIKFGLVAVILIFLILSLGKVGLKAYRAANPVRVEPNVKYGILPKIVFPKKEIKPKTIVTELANDRLPKFSDQANVYIVFRTDKSFLALEQETENARQLGFVDKPKELGNNVYEFKNGVNQTLQVNILDGSFKLTYPYGDDQLLMSNKSVPSKEEAKYKAINFLKSSNKYYKDLEEGSQNASFWKIEGGSLKSVDSISEANLVRVDFYRKNFDNAIKIVSTELNRAPVTVLLSGSLIRGKDVVEVEYKYVNIDRDSFATYPIKTVNDAIADIKAGKYWPVSDVIEDKVIVRNIYLAYFEPISLTNFMQPVYVFEGDNNFKAYVPAVVDRFTK